jgi:hypothetical protein
MKKLLHYAPVILAFIVGWAAIGTLRYIKFVDPNVHFHANFIVQINGKNVDFSQAKYQEDVALCVVQGTAPSPRQRAHLHNGVGDVVHVHLGGVTWGQFFQSLNFNIGNTTIVDDTGAVYAASSDEPLIFYLNGMKVPDITNRPIHSEDRLLISYGPLTAEALAARLATVPKTAATLNASVDPATCGAQETDIPTKLRESFFW